MRATSLVSLLCMLAVTAGCATARDPDVPVRASCSQLECFYERDVRDWELIGQDMIVVFVGGRRCAYRMDLFSGSDCSVTLMTPYLDFEEADARVCIYDAPYINTGVSETSMSRCRVMKITPLTDDELLELYTEVGARPPLPPVGSGEISVGEDDEEADQQSGAPVEEGPPAPAPLNEPAPPEPQPAPENGASAPSASREPTLSPAA